MPVLAELIAGFFGGWEILLIAAIILVLLAAKRMPLSIKHIVDEDGHQVGKSLGGIYGKPAAQAIAHDNQVAEFYEAQDQQSPRKRWAWFKRLCRMVLVFLGLFRR